MKEYKEFFFSNLKKMFVDFKDPEKRKKQIPNYLTFSRALAPIFIIPSILTGNLALATIFTGCFAATDALDGHYARKYNATSKFGKELDPIVDKIFAGSIIIPLTIINPVFLVTLIGEASIAAVGIKTKKDGCPTNASIIGKIKTVALSTLIASAYGTMAFGWNPAIVTGLLATTTVLQGAAVIDYYKKYKTDMKNKEMIDTIEFDVDKEIEKDKQKEYEKEICKTLDQPHDLLKDVEEIDKPLIKEKKD